jgi:hypothetical protein
MFPGELADMNTSGASTAATAAFKLAMSASTAEKSFQERGPLQAGRGAAPGRPVLDVGGPAALALLAIVDDGEPRLYLPADAFGDGRAHVLLQRRIDGAPDTRHEARMKRRRLGQAAHVRAQDPVDAALHWLLLAGFAVPSR